MNKRIRQYIGLLSAVLMYYIIHEGAHLIYALSVGVFRKINFMGLGVQIGIYEEQMSNLQLGIFCLSGAAATMVLCRLQSGFLELRRRLRNRLCHSAELFPLPKKIFRGRHRQGGSSTCRRKDCGYRRG